MDDGGGDTRGRRRRGRWEETQGVRNGVGDRVDRDKECFWNWRSGIVYQERRGVLPAVWEDGQTKMEGTIRKEGRRMAGKKQEKKQGPFG